MNEKVLNIATSTETAKNVFEVLSSKQRFHQETDLRALRQSLLHSGKKVVADDYLGLFKNLEKAGVGSIISGRGNKPSRFKWHYKLRDVAKAVSEGNSKKSTNETPSPKKSKKETLQIVIPIEGLTKADILELIAATKKEVVAKS